MILYDLIKIRRYFISISAYHDTSLWEKSLSNDARLAHSWIAIFPHVPGLCRTHSNVCGGEGVAQHVPSLRVLPGLPRGRLLHQRDQF